MLNLEVWLAFRLKTCKSPNQDTHTRGKKTSKFKWMQSICGALFHSTIFYLSRSVGLSSRKREKNGIHKNFWSFIWLVCPESFRSFPMKLEHLLLKAIMKKEKQTQTHKQTHKEKLLWLCFLFLFALWWDSFISWPSNVEWRTDRKRDETEE